MLALPVFACVNSESAEKSRAEKVQESVEETTPPAIVAPPKEDCLVESEVETDDNHNVAIESIPLPKLPMATAAPRTVGLAWSPRVLLSELLPFAQGPPASA